MDDGPTPLRAGSTGGLLLRAVEGEDDYEAGAVEFARFLLEVFGFRGVVLVDARHALLYERGSLTTLAVDLSPSAASCLAVYEGTPVGAALAAPAELGSAVAAAVGRGPVDTPASFSMTSTLLGKACSSKSRTALAAPRMPACVR